MLYLPRYPKPDEPPPSEWEDIQRVIGFIHQEANRQASRVRYEVRMLETLTNAADAA